MKILPRYMSRLFLTRSFIVTVGMVGILAVLDALSKGEVLPPDAGLAEHFRFMFLRAPLIFEQVFVFVFLLSLLATYVTLIKHNELVPIVLGGLSVFGQIRALAPVVLLFAAAYAVLIDQGTPRAQEELRSWLGPEAVIRDSTVSEDLWISDGDLLVRITSVGETELSGLTIFERAETGTIRAVTFAQTARAEENSWRLSGVEQVRFDGGAIDPLRVWSSDLGLETLRLLALEPRYLSVTALSTLATLTGVGSQSSKVYRTWIYSRLSLPLAALAFMVTTVLAMQRFGRDPRSELVLVVVMAAGFGYVVLESIVRTLPGKTDMAPLTAALVPLACIVTACLVLIVRNLRSP